MISHRIAKLALVGLTVVAFAGCASHHDRRANNAMMGAGLGAAAGAVVSQGDPVYAVGGAAVGGLLGHVLTKEDRRSRGWGKDDRRRHHAKHRDHRRSHGRHHRHR